MRKPVLILISLLLAVWLPGCAPKPQEFKSEAGRFSVMTPVKFEESTNNLKTEAGKIDLHLFAGLLEDIAYVVAYSDYPPENVPPDYAEKMLNGARNGAVGNTHGRLVSETKISLADHPGRELVIETRGEDQPPTIVKGRMFMVKNRLYQITVVAPRGKADDKIIDDFLQSFKLLGQ